MGESPIDRACPRCPWADSLRMRQRSVPPFFRRDPYSPIYQELDCSIVSPIVALAPRGCAFLGYSFFGVKRILLRGLPWVEFTPGRGRGQGGRSARQSAASKLASVLAGALTIPHRCPSSILERSQTPFALAYPKIEAFLPEHRYGKVLRTPAHHLDASSVVSRGVYL